MFDDFRCIGWTLGSPTNWGWILFGIAGNVLVYLRGREASAVVAGIVGLQWSLFELARNLDIFWAGTVLTHSGPDEAIAVALPYIGSHVAIAAAFFLPIAAFASLPRFREALRSWRWTLGATMAGALTVSLLFIGTVALLRQTKFS